MAQEIIKTKQSVCDDSLSDELSDALFYSKANRTHLDRTIEQLNKGLGKEHELIEVDE